MKVGFLKSELIRKDIRNEMVRPEVMPDDTWHECLMNERETGRFQTDEERQYREAEEAWEASHEEYQKKLKKEKNNSPLIFVRSENYMSGAKTRRNMFFYNKNEKVQTIQCFPVRENMLESINQGSDRDGIVFEAFTPPEGWFVYSLDWGEVNRYVANEILSYGFFKEAITQEEPPEVLTYSTDHHCEWWWKEEIDMWGNGSGFQYLSFDITHQVVFSAKEITAIRED